MGRYSQADLVQTFHFTKGGETEVSGKAPGPLPSILCAYQQVNFLEFGNPGRTSLTQS